jgi:hypothetical protein
MKYVLFILVLLLFWGCTPFHQLAKKTEFGSKDGYSSVYNNSIHFESLTYGDFKFATSNKAYKQLKSDTSGIKDILFYGKTINPAYDYYVLLNPVDTTINFHRYESKTLIKNGNRVVMLISFDDPFGDAKFLFNNFKLD